MSGSIGAALFTLQYSISPITLVGGIAANLAGAMMPIISITDNIDPITGLILSGGIVDETEYFAYYQPLPGGTLGDNEMATYPFASRSIAANALIFNPLSISVLMICPSRIEGGYAAGLSKMTALQSALNQHDALGGTYIFSTPKFLYNNLVRLRMADVSTAETKQVQNTYQIDFRAPLLTLQQAQQSQSALMTKMTNGTQVQGTPTWSGTTATTGQPP